MLKQGVLEENPIKDYLAAISCGIVNAKILMDLDYDEDSNADVDANFIFTKKMGISEVQISGESSTFSLKLINEMVKLSLKAVENIFDLQKNNRKNLNERILNNNPIVIASHNEGKIAEFKFLFLPYNVKIFTLSQLGISDVEETGKTFEENALIKVKMRPLKLMRFLMIRGFV